MWKLILVCLFFFLSRRSQSKGERKYINGKLEPVYDVAGGVFTVRRWELEPLVA